MTGKASIKAFNFALESNVDTKGGTGFQMAIAYKSFV